MTIGERLRDLRKQNRKTLREVNEDTGINYANLSEIERNEHGCNAETLKILADYYGVTVDYILGNTDKPKAINIQVAEMDGSITDLQYELLDLTKGFTADDFQKVNDYIELLKAKKEVDKNEK